MPDMSQWVPVASSATVGVFTVAGIAITQYWTSWRDHRLKALEVELQRANQRDDFQRKTLLQLQVAMRRYARTVGKAHHHDVMEHRKTGKWGSLLGDDLNHSLSDTLSPVMWLKERVHDDKLRMLIKHMTDTSSNVLMARSK